MGKGFSKLLQFKEANGHCKVPSDFQLDGFKLGIWVASQRKNQNSMSPERQQRLDNIGFIWDALTERWEEGFSKLLQFKELKGHCRVSQGLKLDGFNLGKWVSHRRRGRDSMTTERRQMLDDIGFIWDATKDKT